jgi:hypothetical protein
MNKKVFTILLALGLIVMIMAGLSLIFGSKEWIYLLIGINAILIGWIGILQSKRRDKIENPSSMKEKEMG